MPEMLLVQIPVPVADSPLSLTELLLNLGIGAVASLFLRWHYIRFGSALANRKAFATNFPIMILTTTLLITVVKSSLALSLGLVGALSIVRFRTPIKEPEELAYLFLAIATGVGLGAAQTIPTVVAVGSILLIMLVMRWRTKDRVGRSLFLSVGCASNGSEEETVDRVSKLIADHVSGADLRRLDVNEGRLDATFVVDVPGPEALTPLVGQLRKQFGGMEVTVIDQQQSPSSYL